jgi:NAD(P)H-dependent FMN reductase
MTTYQVGYFVGSLSSKSINRILSKALIRLAPKDLEPQRDTDRQLAAIQPGLRR